MKQMALSESHRKPVASLGIELLPPYNKSSTVTSN